jgi:hypothetical protein
VETAKRMGPPYGPVQNTKTVIEQWRDRSMPDQVGEDWLEKIGLSPNLAPKNLHGLRFLGLIDEQGYTTDVARRLREATSEEYAAVLEQIVRKAFAPVFAIRNPSEDSRLRIEDAFRKEEPSAQRKRMVAYFLGICALAGIPLKEPPRGSAAGKSRVGVPRKGPLPTNPPDTPPINPPATGTVKQPPLFSTLHVPATYDLVLAGLLNRVPSIQTTAALDQWFSVFRAAFELIAPNKKSPADG